MTDVPENLRWTKEDSLRLEAFLKANQNLFNTKRKRELAEAAFFMRYAAFSSWEEVEAHYADSPEMIAFLPVIQGLSSGEKPRRGRKPMRKYRGDFEQWLVNKRGKAPTTSVQYASLISRWLEGNLAPEIFAGGISPGMRSTFHCAKRLWDQFLALEATTENNQE